LNDELKRLSRCGLIEVLPWNLPAGIEENYEKSQVRIIGVLAEI
jgi:hypothetical protein